MVILTVTQVLSTGFLAVVSLFLYLSNRKMKTIQADNVKFAMAHLFYHRLRAISDLRKSELDAKTRHPDDKELLKFAEHADTVFKKVIEEVEPGLYTPRYTRRHRPGSILGRVRVLVKWLHTGQIPPASDSCLHALLIKCLCKGEDVAKHI